MIWDSCVSQHAATICCKRGWVCRISWKINCFKVDCFSHPSVDIIIGWWYEWNLGRVKQWPFGKRTCHSAFIKAQSNFSLVCCYQSQFLLVRVQFGPLVARSKRPHWVKQSWKACTRDGIRGRPPILSVRSNNSLNHPWLTRAYDIQTQQI